MLVGAAIACRHRTPEAAVSCAVRDGTGVRLAAGLTPSYRLCLSVGDVEPVPVLVSPLREHCLIPTDDRNAITNKIHPRIGYRRIAKLRSIALRPPSRSGRPATVRIGLDDHGSKAGRTQICYGASAPSSCAADARRDKGGRGAPGTSAAWFLARTCLVRDADGMRAPDARSCWGRQARRAFGHRHRKAAG